MANLRAGEQSISRRQAEAIAGVMHREFVAANKDDQGEPRSWKRRLLAGEVFDAGSAVKAGFDGPGAAGLLDLFERNRHADVVDSRLEDMDCVSTKTVW